MVSRVSFSSFFMVKDWTSFKAISVKAGVGSSVISVILMVNFWLFSMLLGSTNTLPVIKDFGIMGLLVLNSLVLSSIFLKSLTSNTGSEVIGNM